MVNYKNGKIYKIEPVIESDDGDIYIGSTTKEYLSQRMELHRRDYNNWKRGDTNFMTSFKLFDKYGLDNCQIVLIETCSCDTKDELHRREAHHIRTLQNVNICIPLRTRQEYRDDNKEQIRLYNQNKIRPSMDCECGISIKVDHLNSHLKTQKHLNFLEQKINIPNKKEMYVLNKNEIRCECGSVHTIKHKWDHLKTEKHLKFINETIVEEEEIISWW